MPFAIPSQADVAEYIRNKKPEWPPEFADYYADRFWNHYQASGWKLSNGNSIKDWKACFNANWQHLKFKEDLDSLAKAQASIVKKASVSRDDMKAFVENMVRQYAEGKPERRIDVLVAVYDWLKKNNLAKLPKETIERIVREAGNNRDMAKCMSVHAWIEERIKQNRIVA